MVAARTTRLSVFCLTSLCGLGAARAAEDPEGVTALLPAAHTDVQIGFGLMTVGLGVMVGHRFANGLRIDGALGTLVLVHGGTVAAGGSLRLVDSTGDALEVPLLVGGTLVLVTVGGGGGGNGGQSDGCSGESDCNSNMIDRWVAAGSVMTGLDWVHRRASPEDSNFILSLRAGPAWLVDKFAFLPQIGAGWSF